MNSLFTAAAKVPRYEVGAFLSAIGIDVAGAMSPPISLPPPSTQEASIAKPSGSGAGGKVVHIEPAYDIACKDGDRTDALTKLAGHLIAQNHAFSDVIATAIDWNGRNTPPLGENKVRDTCMSILSTHLRNHAILPTESGELQPLFDLADADISRLLSTPAPIRRWLLQDFLPLGQVGAIIAPGGTGKSQFVLQMGISIASGTKFAGTWDVGESGSALLLFAEDDIDEIHRRLEKTIKAYTTIFPALSQQLPGRLWIKSLVSQD